MNLTELRALAGHKAIVRTIAFASDGTLLATGAGDGVVHLWDSASIVPRATFQGHKKPINSLCFSPDGKVLVTAAEDIFLKLWDTSSGKETFTFGRDLLRSVLAVVYSPTNKQIYGGGKDGFIHIWNVGVEKQAREVQGHAGPIRSIALSPDGKVLASGGDIVDKSIKCWDSLSLSPLRTIDANGEVYAVAFSPDGQLLAAAIGSEGIKVWRWLTGDLLTQLKTAGAPTSVVFSSTGEQLFSAGSFPSFVCVWDTSDWHEMAQIEGHQKPINSLAYSPVKQMLASGSDDFTVKLWAVGSATARQKTQEDDNARTASQVLNVDVSDQAAQENKDPAALVLQGRLSDALEQLDQAIETQPNRAANAIGLIIQVIQRTRSWQLRTDACKLLSRIGPAAVPAVPELRRIIRGSYRDSTDVYDYLRETAVEALGKIGPAAVDALPDLIELCQQYQVHGQPEVPRQVRSQLLATITAISLVGPDRTDAYMALLCAAYTYCADTSFVRDVAAVFGSLGPTARHYLMQQRDQHGFGFQHTVEEILKRMPKVPSAPGAPRTSGCMGMVLLLAGVGVGAAVTVSWLLVG